MRRTCALALLVGVAALGCRRDAPGAEPIREASREQTVAGVRFLEVFSQGADQTSLLLVGLHGRGGSPERFGRALRELPAKLALALAQAPLAYASGAQWFDWPPAMTDDALADAIGAAEARSECRALTGNRYPAGPVSPPSATP